MNQTIEQIHPSLAQLMKAVFFALAAAALILVTTVLPAEYGVDPLGAGRLLGLTELNGDAPAGDSASPAVGSGIGADQAVDKAPVVKFDSSFNTEEVKLILEPYDGIELKALMTRGERIVFSWETDGADVYVEMHGEEPDATEEFTSYWKEKRQQNARGAFVAPFDGAHGWYWQNMGESAVTITVKVSGFFQKLYTP